MDRFFEKLGWEKLSLFIGGFGIALGFFVIISFIGLFTSEERTSKKGTPPVSIPTSIPIPSSITTKNNEQVYFSDEFRIRYPSGWIIETPPLSQARAIVIRPPGVPANDAFPRVDVQIYARSQYTVEKLTAQIAQVGFRQTPNTFQGKSAIRLEALENGQSFIRGNPQKKDVKKIVYIFEHNGLIYLVDYSVYKDTNELKVEQQLKDILATFQL